MAVETPVRDFGWKATEFSLPATDGKARSLSDIAGQKEMLVMFVSNRCSNAIAALDRAIRGDRNLVVAMYQLGEPGQGPRDQIPCMARSIKWEASA